MTYRAAFHKHTVKNVNIGLEKNKKFYISAVAYLTKLARGGRVADVCWCLPEEAGLCIGPYCMPREALLTIADGLVYQYTKCKYLF